MNAPAPGDDFWIETETGERVFEVDGGTRPRVKSEVHMITKWRWGRAEGVGVWRGLLAVVVALAVGGFALAAAMSAQANRAGGVFEL